MDEPARREVLTQVCAQFSVKAPPPLKSLNWQKKKENCWKNTNQLVYVSLRRIPAPCLKKSTARRRCCSTKAVSTACRRRVLPLSDHAKNSRTRRVLPKNSQKNCRKKSPIGLAYGIDSVAHRSALKAELKTSAVLGSGIFNIYPPSNTALGATDY
ncbi:hypothetical protein CHS0354_030056 [Potamilus streckersoni]|uniref:Smf/DprA SLOG domain-containing protein n=1 Tax=Potamilus streckersoni TaxID=2493646 RepID=A0AAE0RL83_9BIVA|nr:hypothetical protein CHS0354_030056 [Potamilus streckersoni]